MKRTWPNTLAALVTVTLASLLIGLMLCKVTFAQNREQEEWRGFIKSKDNGVLAFRWRSGGDDYWRIDNPTTPKYTLDGREVRLSEIPTGSEVITKWNLDNRWYLLEVHATSPKEQKR